MIIGGNGNDLLDLMRRWNEIKSKHHNALILFRRGDYYESYEHDAKKIADILGITLLICNSGLRVAYFSCCRLDEYLPKLIRAGYRIAICDAIDI